jgi:uncharacterized protein with NRDE domain
MCLIVFSLNHHPDYKLIVAANRDEFYARKTAPASFWPGQPSILGGRDLEACANEKSCGTWLGITRSGRIGMLTNYRDPANIDPQAPSRGRLVSDFLAGSADPLDYLKDVVLRAGQYNGFNLVAGDPNRLLYYSNYGQDIRTLEAGLYGLSNHLLETPWPKVQRAKLRIGNLMKQPVPDPEALLSALFDDETAPDDQLPDTGVGIERERMLSSVFIKSPSYGSRCSTVVMVDKSNRAFFAERVYDVSDFSYTTNSFEFEIESPRA